LGFRLVTSRASSAFGFACVLLIAARAAGDEAVPLNVDGAARTVIFSPDGKRLAAFVQAKAASHVAVFDTEKRKEVRRLELTQTGSPECLAFSPDGRLFAAHDEAVGIRLWNVNSWTEKEPIPAGGAQAIGFSPDAKRLYFACATGGKDGTGDLRVWDLERESEHRRLDLGSVAVPCVSVSGDGKALVHSTGIRGKKGGIELRDAETLKLRGQLDVPLSGRSDMVWVTFAPRSSLIAASTRESLVFWDPGTQRSILVASFPHMTNCLDFSPDGRWLATAAGAGQDHRADVILWNVATRKPDRVLKHPAGFALGDLAFSPAGQKLATAVFNSAGNTLYLWDLSASASR
jgi:WD40 repeat protein